MVQIDFFDKNIISTLVPVFSLKPDILYFLYDKEYDCEKDRNDFRDAILYRLPNTSIEYISVNRHDIDNIREVLDDIIKKHTGEDICMEITGGAELMIAAATEFALTSSIILYYLDLTAEKIYQVYDRSKQIKIQHLTAGDYLAASGAKYRCASHYMPEEDEFDNIIKMCEEIFDHIPVWNTLNHFIANYASTSVTNDFKIDNLKTDKASLTEINHLLKRFVRYGFLKEVSAGRYMYVKSKYKQYMTNYGIWLEMYIYILAKRLYHEVYLGFVIDWRKNDGYDTSDNEIDVVVMHKSIPMLISCKMTKPASKDITEIGYLAKRFGGDDCISCLATTYSLENEKEIISSVYNRFKNMNVGLIQVASNHKEQSCYMFDRIFRNIPSKKHMV